MATGGAASKVIAVGRDEARLKRLDAEVPIAVEELLAGEPLTAAPAAGFTAPFTTLSLRAVAEA